MTSSWFFLSTLNYDARSTTHQILIFSWYANVCCHHHCSGRSVTAKNTHTTDTAETRSFTAIFHVGFVLRKSITVRGFLASTSLHRQRHSTNAPYSHFFHLPQTLHNISNREGCSNSISDTPYLRKSPNFKNVSRPTRIRNCHLVLYAVCYVFFYLFKLTFWRWNYFFLNFSTHCI